MKNLYYIEEFKKELRTMLSDFVGATNTQNVKDIIKIKTQEIFDKYKINKEFYINKFNLLR